MPDEAKRHSPPKCGAWSKSHNQKDRSVGGHRDSNGAIGRYERGATGLRDEFGAFGLERSVRTLLGWRPFVPLGDALDTEGLRHRSGTFGDLRRSPKVTEGPQLDRVTSPWPGLQTVSVGDRPFLEQEASASWAYQIISNQYIFQSLSSLLGWRPSLVGWRRLFQPLT